VNLSNDLRWRNGLNQSFSTQKDVQLCTWLFLFKIFYGLKLYFRINNLKFYIFSNDLRWRNKLNQSYSTLKRFKTFKFVFFCLNEFRISYALQQYLLKWIQKECISHLATRDFDSWFVAVGVGWQTLPNLKMLFFARLINSKTNIYTSRLCKHITRLNHLHG
jgi:hypothetical protein